MWGLGHGLYWWLQAYGEDIRVGKEFLVSKMTAFFQEKPISLWNWDFIFSWSFFYSQTDFLIKTFQTKNLHIN